MAYLSEEVSRVLWNLGQFRMRLTIPGAARPLQAMRMRRRSPTSGPGSEEPSRATPRAPGLDLVEELADDGVSGTKPLAERPWLSALLARVLGNSLPRSRLPRLLKECRREGAGRGRDLECTR